MLQYRFDRILKARGIDKSFAFLQKGGFSDNLASRIKNNQVSRLDLRHLERLCLLLKCTPNDLLQWTPDSDSDSTDDQPLNQLRGSDAEIDMVKTINSIPLGKLEKINRLIKEELEK